MEEQLSLKHQVVGSIPTVLTRFYTVYRITNEVNGAVYIGAHVTTDLEDGYFGSGKALALAVRKYGKTAFVREVVAFAPDEMEMFALERRLVVAIQECGAKTYNLQEGGHGGWSFVNSFPKKPSMGFLGKRHTIEARAKITAGNKRRIQGQPLDWTGRKHKPDSIEKMSLSQKARRAKVGSG